MPQDGTELVAQAPRAGQEPFQRLGGVPETFDVREVTVGLDGIEEALGCLLPPAVERLLRGETVEGIVDLDGLKVPGIVAEPAGLGQGGG